jgi:Sulfotransferase family
MSDQRSRHHQLRRLLQAIEHPRHMLRLQQMRRSQSATGYSLAPFDRTNSIFIHIPKASGVSIARSLYGNLAGGHMPMRDYEVAFSPNFIRNSFVFTFVRNPWDRLHSAYRFLAKGGMNRADAAWLERHRAYMTDFKCFVENGLADPRVAASIHITPQERYLVSASYGYQAIDFVGFFETIKSDFHTVSSALFGKAISLAHANKTSGEPSDYRQAYTDAMKEVVAEFYAKDIELFGYDFEGLSIANQIRRRDQGLLF